MTFPPTPRSVPDRAPPIEIERVGWRVVAGSTSGHSKMMQGWTFSAGCRGVTARRNRVGGDTRSRFSKPRRASPPKTALMNAILPIFGCSAETTATMLAGAARDLPNTCCAIAEDALSPACLTNAGGSSHADPHSDGRWFSFSAPSGAEAQPRPPRFAFATRLTPRRARHSKTLDLGGQ
jgi:hypothetical protein